MGKIIVDQIQKPGGSTFTIPTTAAAGYLRSDVSGALSIVSPEIQIPDNYRIVGSIVSQSGKGNLYSTGEWTSSGPNSTYQNATAAGTNATYTHQSWNMALGDGYPNGVNMEYCYTNDYSGMLSRKIEYAHGTRLGWMYRSNYYYDNASSYGGVTWRILPVRNTTNTAITRNLPFAYSSYDTYNGAALGYFTPANSSGTTYSTVTSGTWTQPFSATSNTITHSSAAITIPPNTTILVMLITSHNYQTTYWFTDSNLFMGLNTFFPLTGDLICDNRMLQTLSMHRDVSLSSNSLSAPQDTYTACATLFGDR